MAMNKKEFLVRYSEHRTTHDSMAADLTAILATALEEELKKLKPSFGKDFLNKNSTYFFKKNGCAPPPKN